MPQPAIPDRFNERKTFDVRHEALSIAGIEWEKDALRSCMTDSVLTSNSEAYALFSDIFLTGLLGPAQARVRTIPRLREVLVLDTDDELAAEHETMFGFNVYPFASLFLESDRMLGGETTQQIRAFASRSGIDVGSDTNAPDHIATELRILERLAKNDPPQEDSIAEFIDQHLFSWLPAFVVAVREESNDFYSEVADLMLEHIVDHRRSIPAQSYVRETEPEPEEHLLSDRDTGIHDIADFLTSPARCGFFLSRSTIAGIAQGSKLPHGFGGRSQMMVTSIRSASAYGGLDLVICAIADLIDRNRSAWETLSESGLKSAHIWSENWLTRLNHSSSTLEQIASAIRREESD
ncbi:MAG: molecular chaperone TorD family protein [Bacteroidetes bacterium]|nr:molecular chaperone TorD family protein [Bacteroidota bacterium]